MKEHPILFSGPLVRAILDGRKTQTRRIAKISADTAAALEDAGDGWSWEFGAEGYGGASRSHNGGRFAVPMRCPFGAPGDRLWVRETWAGRVDVNASEDVAKARHYAIYRADGNAAPDDADNWHDYGGKWRPSIHMPRWASRITLAVTAVRVERLQSITGDCAKAEGAPVIADDPLRGAGNMAALSWFSELWDAINGDRAAWASNPWVWVVEFKRIGGAP